MGNDRVDDCPRWPPDAFALSAALLQRSGAYRVAVSNWPPDAYPAWTKTVTAIGRHWRMTAAADAPVPAEVEAWWQFMCAHLDDTIDSIDDEAHLKLAQTLIQICAAADEASADAGTYVGVNDEFSRLAQRRLLESSGCTLCRRVDESRAVVLPKLHTPQRGLTMRSLSHYLALYLSGQIRPRWHNLPSNTRLKNVLILPWPLTFDATRFRVSQGPPVNMPDCYGYFVYNLAFSERGFPMKAARHAIEAAKAQVGSIDAVIFPELALRGDDYIELCADTQTMVVAGVGREPYKNLLAKNGAAVAVPTFGMPLSWKQSKHHRWQLDGRQIEQYGLQNILDPKKLWWEHIEIRERAVNFLTLNNDITMAVLICEDMARLDPVNELLVTVGPTLVISLLMDGPPVEGRWPDRYATVLADDPGGSVLTVTSLGMARAYSRGASSVIALWKDAKSPRQTITMSDPNAVGVVLKLKTDQFEEWTADGRSDYAETFYLRMAEGPTEIINASVRRDAE